MFFLKHIFIVLVISVLFGAHAIAQRPVLNNTPSTLRWNQVISPSFRVIFPAGHEGHAQRVVNTLEHLHKKEAKTLSKTLPPRIAIILQDFNTFSNGFISYGPRRGEFFTMPPQDQALAGSNTWLDLLAVHEYRHVVQFHHSRTGFTRLMYYLFGQQTQAGTAFSAVPRWFWEGDATLSETLYTPSGRGRIPAFSRIFKANLLEGKDFNYNKQHLRSYKDYVPDHYKLGYHFVTHLRRRTKDPSIWAEVTEDAFKWSFVPFTFSNSLKKHTGYHLIPNYQMMMDELDDIWRDEQQQKEFTEVVDLNRRTTTTFTDLSYPVFGDDSKLVALRSGIGDIEQFVTIDSKGNPEVIHTPGIMNDGGMLSIANNILVWNEIQFDPRWRQKTYSVIKSLNVNTGETQTITGKTRYAGASLAPDGMKIVTSLTTSNLENHLVVLNSKSGRTLNTLSNPDNGHYAMARWSDDGNGIISLKTNNQGKGIVYVDYINGTERYLLPPSDENVAHPLLYKEYLFFNSPYDGTDNIHVLDVPSGRRFQVTNSRYGAYNAVISPDGKSIVYNDHRVGGLDIVSIPFDTAEWKLLPEFTGDERFYFQPLKQQEEELNLMDSVPAITYDVTPYRKFPKMFNVHSWGLLASSDLNQLQAGITSQDILSTTNIALGYVYDRSEKTGFGFAEVSYQGLFPIIDLTFEHGNRESDRGSVEGEDLIYSWNETSAIAGLRVPLILTKSKWISELTFQERVGVTKITEYEGLSRQFRDDPNGPFEERLVRLSSDTLFLFLDDELSNGDLVFNNFNIFYYALLKQSTRDIASKYGAVVNLRYLSTPFGGDFKGNVLAASGILYLPSPFQLSGLPMFKHHSLAFRAAYQYQPDDFEIDYYRFRNQIPLPRGYSYPDFAKFSFVGVEYAFPAWYPDAGIGPLFFFKRLRVKGFFDHGTGSFNRYFYSGLRREVRTAFIENQYNSTGVELMMDFHVMRFSQEIGVGVRYSRLLSTNGNSVDLLLSIDF